MQRGLLLHRSNNEWHKINAMGIALLIVHRGNEKWGGDIGPVWAEKFGHGCNVVCCCTVAIMNGIK